MWMPFGHSLNSTSPRDLGCSWSNDPVGGFNDLTFPHDVTFFGDGLKGCWWPPTKGSKGHGLNHLVGTHTKRVKWSNLTNIFFSIMCFPFTTLPTIPDWNDEFVEDDELLGGEFTNDPWQTYLQMNQQSTASVRNYYCCQYYHPPKTNTAWKVPSSIGNTWIHWCYFFLASHMFVFERVDLWHSSMGGKSEPKILLPTGDEFHDYWLFERYYELIFLFLEEGWLL